MDICHEEDIPIVTAEKFETSAKNFMFEAKMTE